MHTKTPSWQVNCPSAGARFTRITRPADGTCHHISIAVIIETIADFILWISHAAVTYITGAIIIHVSLVR